MSHQLVSVPSSRFINQDIVDRVHDLVLKGFVAPPRLEAKADPFWRGLRDAGTELWLDTGDADAAAPLWTREFTALTTNNTLLNKEVQKGLYDQLIGESSKALVDLDAHQRVIEIAFILNARHALMLAHRFDAAVSVELHTDLAHDPERSVFYGKRFYNLCPERFIIKVPMTPSGLVATRALRDAGVPVNFTLGFSARHNHLATAFASPSYVNVFLGRLNAYVADNKLGDGKLVGEKAALASQAAVVEQSKANAQPTRQIAASLRDAGQVRDLAGIDVMTMPTTVAAAARKELDGRWTSQRTQRYDVAKGMASGARTAQLDVLWDISERDRRFVEQLREDPPVDPVFLVDRAHQAGCGDLFPRLGSADLARIAAEGKIPKHASWAERIERGELAVDTLLNLAGLASFSADQKTLDDRIVRLLGHPEPANESNEPRHP